LASRWGLATGKDLFTFPAGRPAKQIDYVLYRPGSAFRVAGVRVVDEPVASDHRPLLAVLEFPEADEKPEPLAPYTRPTLSAPRGASFDAPEHTTAAYELALKHGADFVEPDLQMTRDGVLVCLHDTTLERTTDVARVFPDRAREANGRKTWPVAEFTLEEIR